MNALKLLEQQHREVEQLFAKYEELTERAIKSKQQLLLKLADRLAAHATIEEQLFYPEVITDDTEETLRESVEEHLAVKRVIADLLEMTPEDENFDAKVKVLKELVEHHVEEEEGELFPAVAAAFAEELERLGEAMESMFDELMQGEPHKTVAEETGEAAPLH